MPGENEKKVADLEGQVAKMEEQIADLKKQLEAAAAGNPDLVAKQAELDQLMTKTEELTEALEGAITEKATTAEELKTLKAIAALDPAEKAWYDNLKGKKKGVDAEDKKDKGADEATEKFLAMDPAERKKLVKASAVEDEVIKIGDREIRKSAVGEDHFAVMKSQQDQITKNEAELARQRDATELAVLAKRADDEFAHVPGSSAERANMLKEISAMPEKLRKSFEAVFVANEKLAGDLFKRLGTGSGGKDITPDMKKAAADFEAKVDSIRSTQKLSRQEALRKARTAHPDLFKAYQEVETSAN